MSNIDYRSAEDGTYLQEEAAPSAPPVQVVEDEAYTVHQRVDELVFEMT